MQHSSIPCPVQGKPKLASNEIHLHFAYPEQISDEGLLEQYRSLLSEDELAQMARFHFARSRHQFLVTRALIRTSLSAYCPVDPAAWHFNKNRYGKPDICHPDVTQPIRFNLSHTQGLTVCAIARGGEIGVDVEDGQRSTQAGFNSLGSYFSPQEIEDLRALRPDQQRSRFFDYWTLKESYIKARGAGFAIPLSKFSFLFQENRLNAFSVHPDLDDNAGDWQFWRIPMDQRYHVAVALKSVCRDIRIRAVNAVPLQGNEPIELTFL